MKHAKGKSCNQNVLKMPNVKKLKYNIPVKRVPVNCMQVNNIHLNNIKINIKSYQ